MVIIARRAMRVSLWRRVVLMGCSVVLVVGCWFLLYRGGVLLGGMLVGLVEATGSLLRARKRLVRVVVRRTWFVAVSLLSARAR